MKIVQDSAEHHFLSLLEKLKQDAGGWTGLHFALSQKLTHDELIEKSDHIVGYLHKLHKEAEALAAELQKGVTLAEATLYLFADSDVILLARPQNENERKVLATLFRDTAAKVGSKLCIQTDIARDVYSYQQLADARLLGARRVAAYEALGDMNRVHSIPLRRQRRDDSLILIVEDDRFTASYAANILNKEYEIVLAKTGEEAITSYIEHAPDLVFLDIHLPGLSGHETLRAIRRADPEAYVIMLSVDTAKTNVVSASKEGAAGFLKKPFSKERMLHIVKQSPFVKKAQAKP